MNHGNFENRELYPLKFIIEGLKNTFPEGWKYYCPRIYKDVEKYHDYRIVPSMLCSLAFGMKTPALRQHKDSVELGVVSAISAKHGFPMFFVNREMFRAASLTTPPSEIDWQEMNFPFDSLIFVLPKNSIAVKGVEVVAVHITKIKAGNYFMPMTDFGCGFANDVLMVDFYDATGIRYTRRHTRIYIPNLTYANVAETQYEAGMDGEEADITETVVQTAFNLIFAMSARPELVETGRRLSVHKKSKSEIWTPNVIGRKYQSVKNDEPGTHASPRMHWRRGHFRRQNYGVGFAEQKMIWIEPVLVGVKTEE